MFAKTAWWKYFESGLWLGDLWRVALILALALLASRVVSRLIRGLRVRLVAVMVAHAGGQAEALEKRARTIAGILRKSAVTLIWALAIIMALREIGLDIRPLLAGAGIAGIAIGFGAQTLVRDIIGGLFMLIENQIRVNDVVQINGVGGLVEEVNLRTTVLRSVDGTVHIFPNGAITSIANMTRDYSYYVFDIGVAYKEDTDRVAAVMREVAEAMRREEAWAPVILEPLEILGVDKFADSAVILKARIKTLPIKQWAVGRELNRRFKKKFDELGIEIPFPHVSVYFGEASKPVAVQLTGRDEIKQAVREVLEEMGLAANRPQQEPASG
jgi:small conductance mechanosensitive channel